MWPHDTVIVAAGLARYGMIDEAHRLICALLDAAVRLGGRLPELFSGLDRAELASPVRYPTSCSPQAWAAASPLLCLRTILRLDPWVPYGKTWLSPQLPEGIHHLKVERIPLAGARVTVEVEGDHVEVTGLPREVELVKGPRRARLPPCDACSRTCTTDLLLCHPPGRTRRASTGPRAACANCCCEEPRGTTSSNSSD